MDRSDQIKYCKVCIHGDFDFSRGIICGKTNEKADFKDFCTGFIVKDNELYPFIEPESEEHADQIFFSWEKFTGNDRWLLLSVISGMTFFLRLISYSELLSFGLRNVFWLMVLFNGNTIGLVLKKRTDYRFSFFGNFKFRMCIAAGISILNSFFILFIENRNAFQIVGIALLLFSMSLIMSFLSTMAAIPIARFINRKSIVYEDQIF